MVWVIRVDSARACTAPPRATVRTQPSSVLSRSPEPESQASQPQSGTASTKAIGMPRREMPTSNPKGSPSTRVEASASVNPPGCSGSSSPTSLTPSRNDESRQPTVLAGNLGCSRHRPPLENLDPRIDPSLENPVLPRVQAPRVLLLVGLPIRVRVIPPGSVRTRDDEGPTNLHPELVEPSRLTRRVERAHSVEETLALSAHGSVDDVVDELAVHPFVRRVGEDHDRGGRVRVHVPLVAVDPAPEPGGSGQPPPSLPRTAPP